jgi:hypothetical protein
MEDKEIKFEAQFMQLVMGLHGSAWMMLGKVMNPMTQKMEKDLVGAKASIDTLMMLQAKTKGNLSKTEEDFLSNTIQQLQLNYIEETKSEAVKEEPKKEAQAKKTKEGDDKKGKKKKGKK